MERVAIPLVLVVLVSSATAAITITCAQVGDTNEVQISYASSDANLPRFFALDIAVDDGATIDTIASTNPDFWVYLGTLTITDGNTTSYGTPVAPSSDPCALGGLGTAGITIEMGSLYDPCDPNHPTPPPTSGVLLSFRVSSDCNVTISENNIRGGVTMEDTTPAVTNLPTSCSVQTGVIDEFPSNHPDYAEWVSVGKPDSWCYPKQCHGDATGSDELFGRGTWVSVGFQDFQVLLSGYNVSSTTYTNPTDDPWIAADFTHSQEQFGRGIYVRVGFQDFQVLLSYYNVQADSVPADCLDVP